MTQQAEITFETQETIVLRGGSRIMPTFCQKCGENVLTATPEAVTLITHIPQRAIFRLIEANEVHFFEGSKVYVCLNSLAAVSGAEISALE